MWLYYARWNNGSVQMRGPSTLSISPPHIITRGTCRIYPAKNCGQSKVTRTIAVHGGRFWG